MSKCGVFSGLYFPVFGLNTRKYEPEKTLYLNTLRAVFIVKNNKLHNKSLTNIFTYKFLHVILRNFNTDNMGQGIQEWTK